jgi:hypothetical protein
MYIAGLEKQVFLCYNRRGKFEKILKVRYFIHNLPNFNYKAF